MGNVYPPDLPGALADCAEAFRDGNLTYSTRYRVRCKDGSLKWIIDSGKKAQDADGNWMVNSLYLDVTRSEEDAQRLREQTQLLTSIYDTVPCGIIRFVRDIEGRYRLVSINRAVLNLMGYKDMEEGLNDWHDGVLGAVLKEDRLILQEVYRGLREIGDRQDQEYRVRWKDGSIHWLEGTSMVVGVTPRVRIFYSAQLWISPSARFFRNSWSGSRRCTGFPWRSVQPSCLNTGWMRMCLSAMSQRQDRACSEAN